ncbi:LysR substrate-binding domain-containing protein [Rummeliibacillus sp. JY-2-4R]
MEWYQLHYFQTLAKTENITRASELLSLSQSALSRSIARLETEIGVPLFERESRGVKLNRYGRLFLEHATNALLEIDTAKKQINDLVDPLSGTIELAFIQTLGSSYIPELIRLFQLQFPNIKFRLYQDITQKIMNQVETNSIDIGFCSPSSTYEGISTLTILEEELVLIVPKSHKFSDKKEIDLFEVAQDDFILFKEETALRDVIEELCKQAGFYPKVVFEGIDEKTIVDLVSANFGVALVPIALTLNQEKVSSIKINHPKCTRVTRMIWRNQGYTSPAVQHFIHFVTEYAQQKK